MQLAVTRDGMIRCYAGVHGAGRTGEMHLMTLGEYLGHPSGPIEVTREMYAEILSEFRRRPHPLYVDYNHSHAEAGGWIHDLEIRGDELWATKIEWTPRARAALEGDEWRYCSPAFMQDGYTDTVTGEKRGAALINVALTNDPFFEGQHALRLSRAAVHAEENAMQEQVMEVLGKVAEAAGMDLAALLEAMPGKVSELAAAFAAPGADASKDEPEPKAEPSEEDKQKLAEAEAERDAAKAESASIAAERDALKAQLVEAEAAREAGAKATRKALIDAKVKGGFMFETDRADGEAILCSAGGEAMLNRVYASKKVPIGDSQAGDDPNPSGDVVDNGEDMDESDRIAAGALVHASRMDAKEASAKVIALRKRG